MLKITQFFPKSTKDKHTSTHGKADAFNHCFFDNTSEFNVQTLTKEKSTPNISRMVRLAQPRISNKKSTQFSQISSSFNHKTFKMLESQQKQPFIVNKLSENPLDKTLHSYMKSSLFKCPKIDIKKLSQDLVQGKQNKESIKEVKSTLRKNLKCQTSLSESATFLRNRKLKEQKKHTMITQHLKSSDLAAIYNNLYNKYETVPFNQLEQAEPMLINLMNVLQRQTQKQDNDKGHLRKERKSFELKQLEFQKNLRKEIKSLTRDTDHILSLQFRDIREVNNR